MKYSSISFIHKLWLYLCKNFPKFAITIQYLWILGKYPNLKHPKDLNEKIQYMKLHADMDKWARLADKYAVREYVKECGLEEILPEIYGKYDSVESLLADWDKFPSQFVLKSNNGCGTVIIVKERDSFDKIDLTNKLEKWLNNDERYGCGTMEYHYSKIIPCLFVEQYLCDENQFHYSSSVIDYKIWCFNGNPYNVFVVIDRDLDKDTHPKFDLFDLNWNRINHHIATYGGNSQLPKPENLEEMLKVAASLSQGHPQIRVDLYNIGGKIYFGELTLTSQGGYMNYFTPEYILEMGNLVKL